MKGIENLGQVLDRIGEARALLDFCDLVRKQNAQNDNCRIDQSGRTERR
jgi:hypothetical protein